MEYWTSTFHPSPLHPCTLHCPLYNCMDPLLKPSIIIIIIITQLLVPHRILYTWRTSLPPPGMPPLPLSGPTMPLACPVHTHLACPLSPHQGLPCLSLDHPSLHAPPLTPTWHAPPPLPRAYRASVLNCGAPSSVEMHEKRLIQRNEVQSTLRNWAEVVLAEKCVGVGLGCHTPWPHHAL